MARKIKKNDYVIVLTGKDKGKKGILKCINVKCGTVIIEGINIITKHQKSIPTYNQVGGIIKKEAPIHISNIAFFDKENNKIEKIKFSYINGKKVRVCKSNSKILSN